MSGPTFASLALEEVRERRETATPASSPHRAIGGWRGAIGTLLSLGCFAIVGILTAYAFFSVAFGFLAHPIGEISSAAGTRDPSSEASLTAAGLPASAPVNREPAPRATQPGPTGPPRHPAQPAMLAAAIANTPEPRRVQVDQGPGAKMPENASAEIVSGPLIEIRDAMTWVIAGQIVHLWGVRPDPRTTSTALVGLAARVKVEGPIGCRRQLHSTRYRCLTAKREDIGEMVLLSGIGQAAIGAPIAYRSAEVQMRAKGTRHWASR